MMKAKLLSLTILLLFLFPRVGVSRNAIIEDVIDENRNISKEIDELARDLDELLSNRKSPSHNPTEIQLVANTRWAEHEELQVNPQFELNLKLPALEKKWQLRFSSYDREDQYEGLVRNRNGAIPRDRKLGTSLGFIKKIQNTEFLFRPRLEFKDPLVSSILVRIDQKLTFVKNHQFHYTQKFFAHAIDGVGASTELNLNLKLSQTVFLRLFNEGQYLDRDNFFEVSQGPSLNWQFSEKIALSKSFAINSQNRSRPGATQVWNSYYLNSYVYYVSLSHKILKNVLHYQVTPELRFPKELNFKGKAGVNFQLALIF